MKIKVNSDKELVDEIRKQLKDNKNHCPCKLEQTTDTICPCKEFRESKELGLCHCGLYYKTEI